MAARDWQHRGREQQSWMNALLSSIALAVLLFLSTFLPHDTSGVVSGGRPREEAAAPPTRAAKPPHIVLVIVGAYRRWW
jgi:hypothetical protein